MERIEKLIHSYVQIDKGPLCPGNVIFTAIIQILNKSITDP